MGGNPILVTGSHRSGSTWAGRMLSLPWRVGYVHEPFNPNRSVTCRDQFDKWYSHTHGAGEGARQCVKQALRFHYNPFPRLKKGGIRDLGAAGYHLVRSTFHRWIGSRPLMKDPIALLSAEWLHETFGMDVVVMVRHPAAFAGSLKRRGWTFPFNDLLCQSKLMDTHLAPYRTEVKAACREQWTIVEQSALLWKCLYHVVREYQGRHPSWHIVRYEDMATDPRARYKHLYKELGLRWTSKTGTEIERRTESKTERWRERLDASEINHVMETTKAIWKQHYSTEDWK